MQSRQRVGLVVEQIAQQRCREWFRRLSSARRMIVRPAVAAPWCATIRWDGAEAARALGASALAQVGRWRGSWPLRLGTHTPDPASIVPATKVDAATCSFRDELRMLDQLAVHIHDVECAVRTRGQVDRAECRIGRRQELATLFDSPRDERHAGRFENPAVHQVRQAARTRTRYRDTPPGAGRPVRSSGRNWR